MAITTHLQRITDKNPVYVTNTSDIHSVDYSSLPMFTIYGASSISPSNAVAGVVQGGSPYGNPSVFVFGFGLSLPVLSNVYSGRSVAIPSQEAGTTITGVYGGNPVIRTITPNVRIQSFYAILGGVAGWMYEGSYALTGSVTMLSSNYKNLRATANIKEERRYSLLSEAVIQSQGVSPMKGSAILGEMRTRFMKAGVAAFAYPRTGSLRASVSISPQNIYSLAASAKIFDGGFYPLKASTVVATQLRYALSATVVIPEVRTRVLRATVALATSVASKKSAIFAGVVLVAPIQVYPLKGTVTLLDEDEDFNEQVTGSRVRYETGIHDSSLDNRYVR